MSDQVWTMNNERLADFIKCLLGSPSKWIMQTQLNKLTIELQGVDKKQLQEEIYLWLKRRVEGGGG